MRKTFINTLCEMAKENKRIWLLTGDLGYSILEKFADMFSDRYVNVGVAEQNMTGVAAGLALSGKIVFTYSIANFPLLRCLEQVRNDVCYHDLNVNIVSVGAGLAYGPAGYTHHAVEDLAVARSLPRMTVMTPANQHETYFATKVACEQQGPSYLRLGRSSVSLPQMDDSSVEFNVLKANVLKRGDDITLISTGNVLELAMKAADQLAANNCEATVISMPTLFPFDEQAVIDAACRTKGIITVEEHGIGGLGSAVAETLVGMRQKVAFIPIRLEQTIVARADNHANLLHESGITVESILQATHKILQLRNGNKP